LLRRQHRPGEGLGPRSVGTDRHRPGRGGRALPGVAFLAQAKSSPTDAYRQTAKRQGGRLKRTAGSRARLVTRMRSDYLQGMASMQTPAGNRLRDAYRRVNDQIAEAAERSGRRREDVVLVAVTKNASPDQIRAIVEMGQVDLGENRVQHLAQRVAQMEEFL